MTITVMPGAIETAVALAVDNWEAQIRDEPDPYARRAMERARPFIEQIARQKALDALAAGAFDLVGPGEETAQ